MQLERAYSLATHAFKLPTICLRLVRMMDIALILRVNMYVGAPTSRTTRRGPGIGIRRKACWDDIMRNGRKVTTTRRDPD